MLIPRQKAPALQDSTIWHGDFDPASYYQARGAHTGAV